jgi:hypothetical protein
MTATVHYWKVRLGLPVQSGDFRSIAGAEKPRHALKLSLIHMSLIRTCSSLSSERPCSTVLHTPLQMAEY